MGMLVGFDSYTKCVLVLYKLFCSVFMHLSIVLWENTLFIYQQNLIMTIGCEFHKIVSLYQVCVLVFPFLSYMSMLVTIVLVVGTKDCLQTNYGDVFHCCTKFHVCQLFVSTWKTLIFI